MPESNRTEYVVAVDVGSSKIACLIAQVHDGHLEVVGRSLAPSFGVRGGDVSEISRAADSTIIAVAEAAAACGVRVHSVFVCTTGADVKTDRTTARVDVPRYRSQISARDASRLMDNARRDFPLPDDRILLSMRPLTWSVDDLCSVEEPVGLTGRSLRAELAVVSVLKNRVRDLRKLLHEAGMYVEGILPEPEASAAGCLSDDERRLGALVVNIGAATVHAGILVGRGHAGIGASRAWPSGSQQWTEALMARFRMSMACAERVKREVAEVESPNASPGGATSEMIEVSTIDGQGTRGVPLCEIGSELRSQAVAALEQVRDFCREQSFHPAQAAGVVLTGGGAALKGIAPLAREIFGAPCRLGAPSLPNVKDPAFASVAGALAWGAEQRASSREGFLDRCSKRLRRVAAIF